ncbi:MAG: hypothetical protein ACOX9R_00420 [Armatimonadota bacterium]|jgi:hypothetical protein
MAATFAGSDLQIVRDLARRVMELARSEEYERRRGRWRDVNELRRPDRAPVWCRVALAWREILPESDLQCEDATCRSVERALRRDLFKDSVGDDHIVEPWWGVRAVIRPEETPVWGLQTRQSIGSTEQGGFRYFHPIETPEDYERLRVPRFYYDAEATERAASQMQDILGNAMPVRVEGYPPLVPQLQNYLEALRGMGPMMEDLAFRPEMVHRAMAKLTEGVLNGMRCAEEAGVLTTNHHEPMFCSDPVSNPPDEGPVGLHNLWVAANSQEFDTVSPPMHEEFLLSYQKVLFQSFGRVQYGCCESLSNKTEIVLGIPNLRIFVCSFWSDLEKIIDACGTDHCIMWRQSAAQVTLPETLDEHRKHLEWGLQRLQGHHYQIVLRELETLRGHENRLQEWATLAIELAEKWA